MFFICCAEKIGSLLLATLEFILNLLRFKKDGYWKKRKKILIQKPTKTCEILKSSAEVENSFHMNLEEIRQTSNEISILNIGLDLEHISPWLSGYLAAEENKDISIKYQGFILDPESPSIKKLINTGSNIKGRNIKESIHRMKEILKSEADIDIKLHKYDYLSPFSGFVLNNKHVYIAPSFIEKGKLIGGSRSQWIYIKVDGNIRAYKEILKMFTSWANVLEMNSKECW
ncbi:MULTISPECIES: hypothetical protein [Porphyromonas]|uniref:Uncharacterized protein n=1 Tax=Porphyromonas gulae TaxID=111105 RepID=A0A0A2FVX4_9PORP|nr:MULTISPECIES: hypothetical protein [Porphyromonas]KGN95276.1 hypothetical protein HR15_00330 [Porphyromonas gulae]SJM19515.1 hypothetical protein PGIN_13-1_00847 [Porphyromonas gingivalis]